MYLLLFEASFAQIYNVQQFEEIIELFIHLGLDELGAESHRQESTERLNNI